jgi:hypothetical protein
MSPPVQRAAPLPGLLTVRPVLFAETFVDATRFRGTCDRAAGRPSRALIFRLLGVGLRPAEAGL